MRADCFFRRWNRDPAKRFATRNVRVVTVEVEASASLPEILAAALKRGASKGTHQTGIFEVQTDRGIYDRADGMRLDVSTPLKAAKVRFKTWDQLEAEELAQPGAC